MDTNASTNLDAEVAALRDRDWRMLVGGQLVGAGSGRRYADESPVLDETIAHVPDGNERDVGRAVDAAQRAHEAWRRTSARERGAFVARMADALSEHLDELAWLDALDCGAPLAEMRLDGARAMGSLRYFAGLATEVAGRTIPATAEHLHYTVREPYGVAARIIPFNHPFMFAAAKVAAPLVAGNSVVLKPAEATPLSALRMGELLADVLPPGLLSVVVGDGPAAPRALVRHPGVSRIGFTGSQPTGRSVQRDAAETGVKEVSLELGGKNALVAFPDADPDEVADGAVVGMNFTWSGQSCGSTSRLLVHESVADDVIARVVDRVTKMKVGSPLEPDTDVGAMTSRAQYDKTLGYIEVGRAEGARVLAGGGRPAGVDHGRFIAPTVLGNVTPDMRVAREEIFGPVLSVLTWRDEAEAIRIANDVEYGLTASVYTPDVRRAHRIARELDAGYVWVNGSSSHFLGVPFGGVKGSGVGREESLEELLSYTRIKSVNVLLS